MGDLARGAWGVFRERIDGFHDRYEGQLFGPETLARDRIEELNVLDSLIDASEGLRSACNAELVEPGVVIPRDQATAQLLAAANVNLMLASDVVALDAERLPVTGATLGDLTRDDFWSLRRMMVEDLLEDVDLLFNEEDDEGGGAPVDLVPVIPPVGPVSGSDAKQSHGESSKRSEPPIGAQYAGPVLDDVRREAEGSAGRMVATFQDCATGLFRGAVGDAFATDTLGMADRLLDIDVDEALDEAGKDMSWLAKKAMPFAKLAAHQIADAITDTWSGIVSAIDPHDVLNGFFSQVQGRITRLAHSAAAYGRFLNFLNEVLAGLEPGWDRRRRCRRRFKKLERTFERQSRWAGRLQPWIALVAAPLTTAVAGPVAPVTVSFVAFLFVAGEIRIRLDSFPRPFHFFRFDGIPRIVQHV